MGHRVCLLVYQGLCTFEFAMAAEVLGDRSAQFGDRWYRLDVASLEGSPVHGAAGMSIEAGGRDLLETADTIIVPGWRLGPVPAAHAEALTAAARRGARIASICTGAFVLAAAGLLDGRRATTHWRHAADLRAAHPKIEVDPDVLYVDDGDVITSAGSAAGLDMLLHMIRKDYGAATCNAVARTMVVAPHRDGGQAQFVERAVPLRPDSAFARVVEQMRREPNRDYEVRDLAGMAAMSPRTFFRRFRQATGRTPYEWLLRERLEVAKALLELSDRSIDEIATQAGFNSADALRYHFRRVLATTPAQFVAAFRA